MIAIRGATTIDCDCPEQIKLRVKELLDGIWESNNLFGAHIVCIIFSSTSDIRSFYPAKAARECGYFAYPLFSCLEPEIDGALKLCIRVMALADADILPKHVYLHGAAKLRKDLSRVLNIAIDGPAGSGKSTVSKIIAKKFDILYLDTGAMYRACALKCLKNNVSLDDINGVNSLINDIDLEIKYENGEQKTVLDGTDVSVEIRKPEISMAASTVSAIGGVRKKMVELQRKIAVGTSCVLDGRDIGTNVLPNAEFKFYLTASAETRAERRTAENRQKGYSADYGKILEEILKRDLQDKTREIAPLTQAADAILIDSTDMTVDEVVAFIENKIQEKI